MSLPSSGLKSKLSFILLHAGSFLGFFFIAEMEATYLSESQLTFTGLCGALYSRRQNSSIWKLNF
jgi:hypothetical protein